MKLGVALPIVDIGGEPATLREFAQVAEEIGYQGIAAPDHVLGVQCREPARLDSGPRTIDRLVSRPVRAVRFPRRMHSHRRFLDPSIDPGATPDRASRQTGCLSRRLVRRPVPLGVGVGWNAVEFVGLNENFRNRAAVRKNRSRSCRPCGRGCTSRSRANGTIEDAGINPLPIGRKIPLCMGSRRRDLRRCAKWGDGWMPLAYPPVRKRGRLSPRSIVTPRKPAVIRRRSASTRGSRLVPAPRPNGATRYIFGSRSGLLT